MPTTPPAAPRPAFGGTTRLATSFLADIVDGLATAEALWRPHLRHDADDRAKVRLVATDIYEVWLLGWCPGQSVEPHDHGDANAAFVVLEGDLVEIEVVGHRLRRRTLRAGGRRQVAAGTVHDVLNLSAAPASSLHVYSPPLSRMGFYDPVSLQPTRTDLVGWVEPVLGPRTVSRATHPAAARGAGS